MFDYSQIAGYWVTENSGTTAALIGPSTSIIDINMRPNYFISICWKNLVHSIIARTWSADYDFDVYKRHVDRYWNGTKEFKVHPKYGCHVSRSATWRIVYLLAPPDILVSEVGILWKGKGRGVRELSSKDRNHKEVTLYQDDDPPRQISVVACPTPRRSDCASCDYLYIEVFIFLQGVVLCECWARPPWRQWGRIDNLGGGEATESHVWLLFWKSFILGCIYLLERPSLSFLCVFT
jgi:hypothetical protein